MQARSNQNVRGIDVSHWQGQVDWRLVSQSGIKFVYVKATEGTAYKDPLFDHHIQGARGAGLLVGGYHFARFTNENEAREEAKHFSNIVNTCEMELPLVLDLEKNPTGKCLSEEVKAFEAELVANTKKTFMLYTSSAFARDYLTTTLNEIPLWVAHYGVSKPSENGIWSHWQVFQYTNQGRVPGVHGFVDLDEWDVGDFRRVTGKPKREPKEKKPVNELTIQKGDTFWGLELHYSWEHGILAKLNPKIDPRNLRIGEKIKCP